MSGIIRSARTAVAKLTCDRCAVSWTSSLYEPIAYGDDIKACFPALGLGWRIYAGRRSQRTYCPDCGPTVPMRLVHGRESGGSENG